jgi:methylisocitrate lyase
MQHRSRLYELLRYADYNQFDSDIYNFAPEGVTP